MKKNILLAVIPLILLAGCKSNESSGGNEKAEINYHEIAQFEDKGKELSQEEFIQRLQSSFHKSNKYQNVKVIETSDKPLSKDKPDSILAGLQQIEYLVSINNNTSRNYALFDNVLPLNFKEYNPTIYGLLPLSAFKRVTNFSYYLELNDNHYYQNAVTKRESGYVCAGEYEDPYDYGECSYYCDDYALYFDEDFYPQYAEVTIDNQTFYFSFYYFNVTDVPNLKADIDESIFLQTVFARANHSISYNAFHLSIDARVKLPDGVEHVDELDVDVTKFKPVDIHYESFKKLSRLPWGTPLNPFIYVRDYNLTISDYQNPIYPDLDEEKLEDFKKNMFIAPYEDINGYGFNSMLALAEIRSKIYLQNYPDNQTYSYQINEDIAKLESSLVKYEIHFDNEGYVNRYIKYELDDNTKDFVKMIDAKYERSFII